VHELLTKLAIRGMAVPTRGQQPIIDDAAAPGFLSEPISDSSTFFPGADSFLKACGLAPRCLRLRFPFPATLSGDRRP